MTAMAVGVALLLLVGRPEGGAAVMENAQQEAISAAVRARVKSFEAAERARDPEQLLAHYASAPEFHFYHDGRRANYDVMAAGVRKALPGVRSLEVVYGDLEVSVLAADCALVSATFRRDMVINSTGAAIHHEGAVSWVWRNIGGKWLIIHGHISHPLEAAK
jgi:ketosteroid isomerase-like protein